MSYSWLTLSTRTIFFIELNAPNNRRTLFRQGQRYGVQHEHLPGVFICLLPIQVNLLSLGPFFKQLLKLLMMVMLWLLGKLVARTCRAWSLNSTRNLLVGWE